MRRLNPFPRPSCVFAASAKTKNMKFTLEGTTDFTMSVLHTTKDMFISETKKFFTTRFKLESCHWVEVKPASSKLPPILKLKQELEKQKVNQGSLISVLDNCTSEIAHQPGYQIWKTNSGDYLALLWIPLDDNLSQCVILNKIQIKSRRNFESLLKALGPFLYRRWNLCMTVGEAQQQVYKDSLTNLYTQKFLNEVVAKKIEEYKRYKTAFSILFIDVDHFKRVNDSLGHVIGSGVLKEMGNLLEEQIRHSDYAFRYGGDEFIVLLSHTEGDDAVRVAERIRSRVEAHDFDVNGICVNITVSIGLAFFPVHADSAEDIIRIADEAMYYGKNKSRNIVYKAS
jgi:diguanylate cyclase (GGDEF)-like protein